MRVFTGGVRKRLPTIQLHVQIQLHVDVETVTANVIDEMYDFVQVAATIHSHNTIQIAT